MPEDKPEIREQDPLGHDYRVLVQSVHDLYNRDHYYISDLPDENRHFLYSHPSVESIPVPAILPAFTALASQVESQTEPRYQALSSRLSALRQIHDRNWFLMTPYEKRGELPAGVDFHSATDICHTAFGFDPKQVVESAPVTPEEITAFHSRVYDSIPVRVLKTAAVGPDGQPVSNDSFVSSETGEPVKQNYLDHPELLRAKRAQYLKELTLAKNEGKQAERIAQTAWKIVNARADAIGLSFPRTVVRTSSDKVGYTEFFLFIPPPDDPEKEQHPSILTLYPSANLSAHRRIMGLCHELGHALHMPYQYDFYKKDGESEYAVYDSVTPPVTEAIADNMLKLLFPDAESLTAASMKLYEVTGQDINREQLKKFLETNVYGDADPDYLTTKERLQWQRFVTFEEVEQSDDQRAVLEFTRMAEISLLPQNEISSQLSHYRYLRHYIFGYAAYRALVAREVKGLTGRDRATALLELCKQKPPRISQEELTGLLPPRPAP